MFLFTFQGIARHYGLEHGMLEYFLELPELVQRKRVEILNSVSNLRYGNENEVLQDFSCIRCGEKLKVGGHDKAIDHFSLHIWCDSTEKVHKFGQFVNSSVPQNDILDGLEVKYGLTAWLAHNKPALGSLYIGTANKYRNKFLTRTRNILSGIWCCLCQSVYSKSNFLGHYIHHLEPLIAKELASWDLSCRQCIGTTNKFLNYQNLKSHYIERHFKHKVVSVLADIRDISFIVHLRKEMNITVLVDLDEEEDSTLQKPFSNKISNEKQKKHEEVSSLVHAMPEEPKSFMLQLTSEYGSERIKQTSEGSYSSYNSVQDNQKVYPSNLETNTGEDKISSLLPRTLANEETNLIGKNINQHNSVSVHTKTDQKKRNIDSSPHRWLCEGRLLLLLDPIHPNNIDLFKTQWRLGQPVLIANSSAHLNKNLWHPKAFQNDFGHLRHDLINCLTGKTVPKASLHTFWKGFSWIKHRINDNNGTPMLLKLKDWPPSEDLAEFMPKRYEDLFRAFPMKDYTLRKGDLNLAGYLPEYCLKPELGPKMYIAYGSALYSGKASTNLHIDMSDAVNCLVYVGFPKDGNMEQNAKQVLREIDKAGCDILMKKRVRSKNTLPGALWHIFHPKHTIVIRDFLNQVALEKGKRLDPHDDPIHDQSTYLDQELRMRLYKEYGIQGIFLPSLYQSIGIILKSTFPNDVL